MSGKNSASLVLVGTLLCCIVGALQIQSQESVVKWLNVRNVNLADLEPAGTEENELNPKLYVARRKYGGGVIPGKYVDKMETFLFTDNGTWYHSPNCEILVYPRGSLSWIPVEIMKSLENVIIGGIDPRTNEILRICRLQVLVDVDKDRKDKHLMPGKLTSSGECIGVWHGDISKKSNYEVLVINAYGKFNSVN